MTGPARGAHKNRGGVQGEGSMMRSLCFAIGLVTLLVWAPLPLAEPGLVVTTDPQSQPESTTVAPDGALILGSMSKPVIYRAAKGATKAEVTIDVRWEGPVSFLGVLADCRR